MEMEMEMETSFFDYGENQGRKILSSGSQGIIYLVDVNGKFFAVKQLPIEDENLGQLRTEMEIMNSFPHSSNLVSLESWNIEKTNGKEYLNLLMEYFPAGSLANRMANSVLKESEIQMYFKDILEGLQSLHQKGFIHSDLKPGNILLRENEQQSGCRFSAVICDFGISLSIFTIYPRSYQGTVPYTAPEIITQFPPLYSFASDIWSCGATICALGLRQDPWVNIPKESCLWEIGRGVLPPIPSHFSNELKEVISLCFLPYQQRPSAQDLLQHPYFNTKTF